MEARHVHPAEIKILPAYPLAEAARYLGSNPSTLRAWFHGRKYRVQGREKWARAVLSSVQLKGEPISFLDLIEAHVLIAIRRGYGIPLKRFRAAMDFLQESGGNLHFLAHRDFFHDRRDLFVKWEDKLVSLSERGQLVDKGIISEGLKQIIYGDDGFASRFFPRHDEQRQECIVLDPTINFGRPCLVRSGVGAAAIAERFRAGEKIADLAQDYAVTRDEVVEAIRWNERVSN